ncbi:hypothetical protein CTAYLR_010058 [Chrysophaeum taylorii]|uniref:VLRF1 domain-containing protein n=1 Tax=Chrysophaeum taylorii TaxID=2483200 RepID=A0AAD7XLK3_9STRA|nr:hypothetical protein CTAYLR_010058 [Chrysophaeum taylorii]
MTTLLARAEGGIVAVQKRAMAWIPQAAEDGTVGSLWELSYEALEQLASLASVGVESVEETSSSSLSSSSSTAAARMGGTRGLTCIACGLKFESREEQTTHFASEEHRGRRANKVPGAREQDLPERAAEAASSSSSSENSSSSEEEEEEEEYRGTLRRDQRSSTVEVSIGAALSMSVSPAVLRATAFWGGRSGSALTQAVAASRVRALATARGRGPLRAAVVALRSGRFAAALFEGRRMTHHRTFSRYTTRRGQGGAQAVVDGSGKAPKSIGSQLRRHGERALSDEVRSLLGVAWREALASCDLVFVAAARLLRPVLFAGTDNDPAPLDARDLRVQRLPFGISKPTLEAVAAAHARLGAVLVHAPAPRQQDPPASPPSRGATTPPPAQHQKQPQEIAAFPEASDASRRLLEACERGHADAVEAVLASAPEDLDLDARDLVGRRPLHLAAAAGAARAVLALLVAGADPTALDERERPPYYVSADKKTRDAFRTARADLGEEAHDWAAAAVPEGLDAATRAAKKAKDQEKKRRQRDRHRQAKQRAAEQATLRADAEAARIAAKAARDLLDAKLNACAMCSAPIRGAPFTRLDFQYCSSACAQAHRRAQCAAAAEKRMRDL